MRLLLVWNSPLLRLHASASFAKHSLAEVASRSDANRRLFSFFNAACRPSDVQQKRRSPGANGIGPMYTTGGHLLLKSSYNPLPVLQFMRHYRSRYRGWRPKVEVSSGIWQLLNEYDVPATIKRVYNVHIEAAQMTSNQVQLSLHGGNATLVAEMLADPPRKLDVSEGIRFWLLAEGRNGVRVKDIRIRSGALVRLSQNRRSVLLVGPSEGTLAAKRMIDGLHVKRRQIPQTVALWLKIPGKRAKCARIVNLDRKFDTCIEIGPHNDNCDPARLVDLIVVGEREESVDDVLAIIDGLHVKRRQIPQTTAFWLKIPLKGAKCARIVDLDLKFDTSTVMGPHNDDSDPARLVGLIVVGEREESVDDVLAKIGAASDGLRVKRRRIQRAVRSWLTSTSKGAERARSVELSRKFDTYIHSGPLNDNDDPDCMFDLAVVGEREENVDDVLATIDGLHVRHGQISRAVCWWLLNTRNGVTQDRRVDLDRECDTRVYIRPLNDDIDPTRMEDFAVVGERKENVDQILAAIGSIVVEKVNATKAQEAFWTGHEDDRNRNRPLHELEGTTDTHIVWDEDAGCLHVSGGPEGVKEAMELIRERLDTPLSSGSGT